MHGVWYEILVVLFFLSPNNAQLTDVDEPQPHHKEQNHSGNTINTRKPEKPTRVYDISTYLYTHVVPQLSDFVPLSKD